MWFSSSPVVCFHREPGRFMRTVTRVVGNAPKRNLPDRDGHYGQEGERWAIRVLGELRGAKRLAVLVHEAGHHLSRIRGWPDAAHGDRRTAIVTKTRDGPSNTP